MSPFLLVTIVVVLLMAKNLTDAHRGTQYVCPVCGARSERRHSTDCPWSRMRSD
jgi:predicted RNA-binding Zn-ribbon protein involved in translation (DUF1610 family)